MILKLIEKKNIPIDDNNRWGYSEWIKINLPAKTHLFESDTESERNKIYLKRILSHNGEIVWRYSSLLNGEWFTIPSYHINCEIYEKCFNTYLREEKLKRICEKS